MPRALTRALALALPAAGLLASCRAEQRPMRVVLVTIDTLRYDSFAGGPAGPSLMPHTQARAAKGRTFERAFAAASCTQPSHASMFTGLHPWEHGVTRNGQALAATQRTVAESLTDAGFETFAVVASVPVSVRFGFGQGFRRFAEPFTQSFGQDAWEGVDVPGGRFYALAETVTDEALRQLDAARGRRQFLWVHYFDPHSPYGDSAGGRVVTPAEVLRRMADGADARLGLADEVRELYGRDVQSLDRSLDRLLERLERDRARFDTHVVVTADHGESLGEDHVIGHGNHLTPEQIHVPLFILSPRCAPGPDRRNTGSVDVAATLLSLAGVAGRLGGGSDLLAPPPSAAHPTLGMRRTYDRPLEALRADGSTDRLEGYLFYAVDGSGAIRVGNGEVLEGAPPSEARALTALFRRFERQLAGQPAPAPLDPETERALRALGYVN